MPLTPSLNKRFANDSAKLTISVTTNAHSSTNLLFNARGLEIAPRRGEGGCGMGD